MKKLILVLMLTAMLVLTVLPTVFAAEYDATVYVDAASGACCDDCKGVRAVGGKKPCSGECCLHRA